MEKEKIKAPCLEAYDVEINDSDIFEKFECLKHFCKKGMTMMDITKDPEKKEKLIEHFKQIDSDFAGILKEADTQFDFFSVYAKYSSLSVEEFLEIISDISKRNSLKVEISGEFLNTSPKSICDACRETLIDVLKDILKHLK